MKHFIFFIIFTAILEYTSGCNCPYSCSCSGSTVVCTDVTSIPTCFPNVTTELTIQSSPHFDELDEDDIPMQIRNTLVTLRFINVGFEDVDKDAFHDMDNLKTLEITLNSKLDEIKFVSNTAPRNLEYLNMASCTELDEAVGLKYLPKLTSINFTLCEFRNVYDSTFQGLTNLKILYLHKNLKLKSISKNAFEDLINLEVLHFDNTMMSSLNPSYFKPAYYAGSLREVNVAGNYYYCKNMCEMTQWMKEEPEFKEISSLGYCSYYSSPYLIKNLYLYDDKLYGCGLGGWAIFGICIGSIVGFALLVAIATAFFGSLKSSRSRTRAAESGTATGATTTIPNTYAAPSLPMGYGPTPPYISPKSAEANNPPPTYEEINTTSQT